MGSQGIGCAHGIGRVNEGVVDGDDVDIVVFDAAGRTKSVLALAGAFEGMGTHALRKTIRPMRPKPLIPTCRRSMAGSGTSGEGSAHLDNHDELSDVLRARMSRRGGRVMGERAHCWRGGGSVEEEFCGGQAEKARCFVGRVLSRWGGGERGAS